MNPPNPDLENLSEHLALCQHVLKLAEQENTALRNRQTISAAEVNQSKRELLSRLTDSVAKVRKDRLHWQRTNTPALASNPQLAALISANQDLMLRALVLMRENERLLLERGLFAPRDLPPTPPQQPHFVANMYRRNAGG